MKKSIVIVMCLVIAAFAALMISAPQQAHAASTGELLCSGFGEDEGAVVSGDGRTVEAGGVTYDLNGGVAQWDAEDGCYLLLSYAGDEYSVLDHWNTKADDTGQSYEEGGDAGAVSGQTLYAIWEESDADEEVVDEDASDEEEFTEEDEEVLDDESAEWTDEDEAAYSDEDEGWTDEEWSEEEWTDEEWTDVEDGEEADAYEDETYEDETYEDETEVEETEATEEEEAVEEEPAEPEVAEEEPATEAQNLSDKKSEPAEETEPAAEPEEEATAEPEQPAAETEKSAEIEKSAESTEPAAEQALPPAPVINNENININDYSEYSTFNDNSVVRVIYNTKVDEHWYMHKPMRMKKDGKPKKDERLRTAALEEEPVPEAKPAPHAVQTGDDSGWMIYLAGVLLFSALATVIVILRRRASTQS